MPPREHNEPPVINHNAMSNGQEPIELSLSPDEASRIIHSHRKVRYGKSAFSTLLHTSSTTSQNFSISYMTRHVHSIESKNSAYLVCTLANLFEKGPRVGHVDSGK